MLFVLFINFFEILLLTKITTIKKKKDEKAVHQRPDYRRSSVGSKGEREERMRRQSLGKGGKKSNFFRWPHEEVRPFSVDCFFILLL